jgi:hypothetical protein
MAVGPLQPLGRFPDVAGKVIELGFVERESAIVADLVSLNPVLGR